MNKLLPLMSALSLLSGCAGLERSATDVALGAGGGFVASKISNGNPAITAAGAVGGVALGEGIHALRTRGEKKSYDQGYLRGRADGVKSVFWDLVEQQRDAEARK